ncbi:S8 family serine peptidase [Streptomyces sp. NPDC058611]|uniref:S8 family serine peptidase n=1 Tax=unclassified Streptomyces TaxID=2593676 RepID=UPI00365A5515
MRVIAYFMHEGEASEAMKMLSKASATESFVIGDIDEEDIPQLKAAGLTVDPLDPNPSVETSAVARADLGGRFSTSSREIRRAELPPLERDEPAQWVLQLGEPLLEDYRTKIIELGVVVHRAIPQKAYLVNATPEQADELINLPFVMSVERYGPQLSAPIRLSARETGEEESVEPDTGTHTWDLVLTDPDARAGVTSWLEEHADKWGLRVLGKGGRRIRIELTAGSPLEDRITQVPGVVEMSEYVPPKLFNDVARALMGVTAPSNGAFPFTGKGQIVAVADTGLDDSHPDFAGRVVDAIALGRPGDFSDPHGHGTHVAGSILGDGLASQGAFQGVAPEAQLYFQSVMDAAGNLSGLPVSLEELFEPAYLAGARIHNNSWGAATEAAYTANSDDVDEYMRKRPDMLVVIAAGNEGQAAVRSRSNEGFVDWLSLGSPGSSKNALTVGAARSSRTEGPGGQLTWGQWGRGLPFPDDPIANQLVSGDPEALAAFSSRGPCDDWRVKPDVVAPGTDILSTRAATAPQGSFWGLHANSMYAYMGGTSMATPLVTGCAALVREYYVRERSIKPSAALLKATLINGTRRLTADDAIAADPHFHQGFGAIHMPSTLPNPGHPDLALAFVDCWETPAQQLPDSGSRIRFAVEAAEGTPLRVCMAYTDLPGRSLQNDLSVMMEAPDGTKHAGNDDLPNQLLNMDNTNNVEIIRLEAPKAGRYTIQVFARTLLKRKRQDYALVVTGKLTSPLRRVIS